MPEFMQALIEPWEAENTRRRVWAVLCPGAEGLVPSPHSRLARGSSLAGAISSLFALPLQKGHGVAEYQAQFLGSCKLLLCGCLLCLADITQSSPCTFLHLGESPAWVLLCSRRLGHVCGPHRVCACAHMWARACGNTASLLADIREEQEPRSKWLGGLNFRNTFSLLSGRKVGKVSIDCYC